MITFDRSEKPEFLESLEVLGEDVTDAVLDYLDDVEGTDFDEFAAEHFWRPHTVESMSTYPGADPLFKFILPLPEGMRPPNDLVMVHCQLYPDVVIVCGVANLPEKHDVP